MFIVKIQYFVETIKCMTQGSCVYQANLLFLESTFVRNPRSLFFFHGQVCEQCARHGIRCHSLMDVTLSPGNDVTWLLGKPLYLQSTLIYNIVWYTFYTTYYSGLMTNRLFHRKNYWNTFYLTVIIICFETAMLRIVCVEM